MKMVEDDGRWWKMVEDDGRWRKMVEDGGKTIPSLQKLSKMRSVEAHDFLHVLRGRHKERQDVGKKSSPTCQSDERMHKKLKIWSRGAGK